jgi:hypothetical protein
MENIDFNSIDDFIDVIPEAAKDEPLVVYVMTSGRQKAQKLRLSFLEGPLAEIKGPRYLVRWSPTRRVLRVEASDRHPYEPFRMGKGSRREIISCPVPAGFAIDGDRCLPEFYVDAVGRAINIEIPAPVGPSIQRIAPPAVRALPAPEPKPVAKTVSEAPVAAKASPATKAKAENRDRSSGFPTRFGDIVLSKEEALVFELLYRRELVNRQAILMATTDDIIHDDRDIRVADTFVTKLREKIEPLGIVISTIVGEGYSISPKSKRFIAQLLGDPVNG